MKAGYIFVRKDKEHLYDEKYYIVCYYLNVQQVG